MLNFKHDDEEFAHGRELAVDADNYAWSDWTVCPEYEIGELDGPKFLRVFKDADAKWSTDRRRYKPLSRRYAALFLEFARWPEEHDMDKRPLESPKNEEAASEWAHLYGALGLSRPESAVFSDANEFIEHTLGMWGAIRPRTRNEGMGGREDTVEAFSREAWTANATLRLYEAATRPESPDMDTLRSYMPDSDDGLTSGRNGIKGIYGEAPKGARNWALEVVSDIVEDKLRGHVWPIPVRDGVGIGHGQGWAFDSLLGAMWLQMLWLMSGKAKRCEWCGKLLNIELEWAMRLPKNSHTVRPNATAAQIAKDAEDFRRANPLPRKPRNDRRFCNNDGRCKAAWNYHHGTGKSSKATRKKKRDS